MPGIAVRPIVFGNWRRWDTLRILSARPEGGVYLLAHGNSGEAPCDAAAAPESLPSEVVYIGITKNLNARPGGGSHAGVTLYHDKIDPTEARLFVAVAPLFETNCADYAVQRIYAEHVEALLIWKFTEQHGYPPVLHYGHKGHYPTEVSEIVARLRGKISGHAQS